MLHDTLSMLTWLHISSFTFYKGLSQFLCRLLLANIEYQSKNLDITTADWIILFDSVHMNPGFFQLSDQSNHFIQGKKSARMRWKDLIFSAQQPLCYPYSKTWVFWCILSTLRCATIIFMLHMIMCVVHDCQGQNTKAFITEPEHKC